jgi:SagB-type dehydrogenase family enzyme
MSVSSRGTRGKANRTVAAALALLALSGALNVARSPGQEKEKPPRQPPGEVILPTPKTQGGLSLDEALARRRSIRRFTSQTLTVAEIGQLLWAAQGITEPTKGLRTAPSAGATFPLEVYLVAPDGVFHYMPKGHRLERLLADDRRRALAGGSSGPEYLREAAVDIVLTGVVTRTTVKFRDQEAARYMLLEAGHATQNVLLEAAAMGLGAVCVGGMSGEKVRQALPLPGDQELLYVIPVGHPR